jgi:hypothetical protein
MKFTRIVRPSFRLDPTQNLREIMEKTGAIQPGVTPEVKETEKRACGCGCGCPPRRMGKVPFHKRVEQLEDDAVNRLVKKATGK